MGNQDQTIKCGTCNKVLVRGRFSNSALKKYEMARRQNSKNGGLPNCRDCTGGSRDEMYCQGCEASFGLENFSKAQRQKSDDAKCLTCAQEAEDRVADVKEAIEEQKILDQLEHPSANTGPWGTATLHGVLSSIGHSNGMSGPTSNTSRTASTADSGQVWIQRDQAYAARGGRSANGASNMRVGGGDPESDSDKTQSTTRGAQSTSGRRSNGAWDNSTPIERAYPTNRRLASSTSYGGTNTGFAKQGAVRPDAVQRAFEQHHRQMQKKAHAGEEDDEDKNEADSDSDDPY